MVRRRAYYFVIVDLIQVGKESVFGTYSVVGKALSEELPFKGLRSRSVVEGRGIPSGWRVEVLCNSSTFLDREC